MEEAKERKQEILDTIERKMGDLTPEALKEKNRQIENRLFDFANFLEARIALLYISQGREVDMLDILRRSFSYNKMVVLPLFGQESDTTRLVKIDNFDNDLKIGQGGRLEPNPERCKSVPVDCIDIAIIPGIAFDEKGGRIGRGRGYYDRLLPDLPITTRKVALAFEDQVLPQLPLESNDRPVDIIITEKRIIYKI